MAAAQWSRLSSKACSTASRAIRQARSPRCFKLAIEMRRMATILLLLRHDQCSNVRHDLLGKHLERFTVGTIEELDDVILDTGFTSCGVVLDDLLGCADGDAEVIHRIWDAIGEVALELTLGGLLGRREDQPASEVADQDLVAGPADIIAMLPQ